MIDPTAEAAHLLYRRSVALQLAASELASAAKDLLLAAAAPVQRADVAPAIGAASPGRVPGPSAERSLDVAVARSNTAAPRAGGKSSTAARALPRAWSLEAANSELADVARRRKR